MRWCAPRNSIRVGEHRQLLQVSKLTQIHLLGELAANGADQVLVVAEPAARKRPFSALRFACTLP